KADKVDIGDVTTLTTVAKVVVPAINELKGIIDVNTNSITINSSSISNLTNNLNVHSTSIATLNNNINTNTASIANLSTNVNVHTTSISALTNNVSVNTASISTLANNINVHSTSISNLSNNLNINSASIANLTILSTTLSNELATKADKVHVGDVTTLTTVAKVVVPAINEVKNQCDSLSKDITTLNNYNVIITNELNNKVNKLIVGDVSTLTTVNKTIVDAINEVKGVSDNIINSININSNSIVNLNLNKVDISKIGDVTTLTTINKVIVPAINEVKNQTTTLTDDINTLTNYNILITNELNNKVDKLNVGDVNTLTTINKTIVNAINEVKEISDLNTSILK
ncbi:MAG: hypothetical protein ACRC7R_02395, partial [Sarcina sp.]